jgi:hypothetical protein
MLRLTAALLVRVGLVLLVMAVLVRLLPMPNRADVVADEFAIAVSLTLTLAPAIYLRLTRDTQETGRGQAKT